MVNQKGKHEGKKRSSWQSYAPVQTHTATVGAANVVRAVPAAGLGGGLEDMQARISRRFRCPELARPAHPPRDVSGSSVTQVIRVLVTQTKKERKKERKKEE